MKNRRSMPESELVSVVSQFLVDQGYYVRHEVPNMGQSADIVATRNGWVFAIEAKIGNWRRALEQCKAHESVADFVCIALDKMPSNPQFLEALDKHGYGVITFTSKNSAQWELKPTVNKRIWRPQRRKFVTAMKEICYVS